MTDTVQVLRRTLLRSGHVDILSAGNSMYPFIRNGNLCRFTRVDACDDEIGSICPGDVLLYVAGNRLIGHRLHRVEWTGDQMMFICKGDANIRFDPPVPFEAVVGRLVSVKGRFRGIQIDSWYCHVWVKVILRFPVYTKFAIRYLGLVHRYHRIVRLLHRRAA